MQPPTSYEAIALQALGALAIAVTTSWITVWLSQKRFRTERMWDRKALAYERVIEAFYKSKRFSREHLDAEYAGRDVSDDRDKELRLQSSEAREEILRAVEIGSFTLSVEALQLLEDFRKDSSDDDHITSWFEHIEHDYTITDKYMKLLIAEAKRDLSQ